MARRVGNWVGTALVIAMASGCNEPVQGSLEIESAAGEAFSFRPDTCADGGELGYWGVQFRDGHRAVDVFKRDDHPYALVYSPGQAAFELALDDCAVFEGELSRRSVNGSKTMRGELTLECTDAQGRTLAGDLRFEDCGNPDDNDDDDDS